MLPQIAIIGPRWGRDRTPRPGKRWREWLCRSTDDLRNGKATCANCTGGFFAAAKRWESVKNKLEDLSAPSYILPACKTAAEVPIVRVKPLIQSIELSRMIRRTRRRIAAQTRVSSRPFQNWSADDILHGFEKAGAPVPVNINSSATTQVIAANYKRKGIFLYQASTGTATAYFGFGQAAQKQRGFTINNTESAWLVAETLWKGAINAISTDDGVVYYQEFE